MNEHVDRHQRPGGIWDIGTTGWLILLYYLGRKWIRDHFGRDQALRAEHSARTMLAIETAQSSKHQEIHLTPGGSAIRISEEDGYLLPVSRVRELAEECLRHRNTRRYGEKLMALPDARTDDGVGGIPLVSYVAGLAVLPKLDALIEARVLAQRERRRLDAHFERGQPLVLSSRNVQIICGNCGGGTFPGLVHLLASRIRYFCNKHGLPTEIIVMGTTPSALSGGDMVSAQANYAAFIRQAVLAMEHPEEIVFHTLAGETLRHTEPLIDRIVTFGPSSGKVTVGTREEVAAQIALAAWLILDAPYGPHADAAFRDHAKDLLDDRYGFRGFSRLGVSIIRLDKERGRAIASAEGMSLATRLILGESEA